MKEFYVVNGNHVVKTELRETPKFYIDDRNNRKFKKSESNEYLAHYRYSGDKWSSTRYYVYGLDHPKPLEILEKNKRSMFAWKVRKAAEEKIKEAKTYSEFIELNKTLELGIEL
jgi:hypothetical protein